MKPCNIGEAGKLEGGGAGGPDQALQRAARLAQRAANGLKLGARLVSALADYGPRYAYHWQQEARAQHQGRRADMGPHLLARLNLAASRRGTRMHALLEGVGRRAIGELDYARLEQDGRAAELVAQLGLAETTDLYTYFRYFGDFRVASWMRDRFLEAHLREQGRSEHVMQPALAAALEQGRPDLILEIVGSKRPRARDRAAIDEATAMAYALTGRVEQAERIWSRTFGGRDRAFDSAVRGRTIAIVGPAPASVDLASEIDSFDLVARTNYLRPVDPRCGSRTDISYYNGIRQRTRGADICKVAPTLSWLVSVRSDDAQLRQLLPGHSGVRAGHRADPLFLSAIPLAMPNILTDLIRFRPRRIRLFGVDFFTGPSAYGKEYHANVVGSDAISHSIRVHDGLSTFRFMQQLGQAGFFEADPRVAQILSLSREQYAARLQDMHGHCTVANENPQKKWHGRPVSG